MLESKVKVKKETVQIYEVLNSQSFSPPKIQQIQDRRLIKQSINIIYSTLINFSAPMNLKISALLFLKKLFQSANPEVILEAQKILPILIQTALTTVNQKDPGALYFVLSQLRPVDQVELSKKYVRFSLEIIKQWGEYMIDLRQQTSPYISSFRNCQSQKAALPAYFLYFTMKDYIEFMLNWNNRKRKNQYFQDKIDIYHFLTNTDHYNKNLQYYKNNLSENSYIIVYETYSILISHSIPVGGKLQVLQSMKDLYQEGNLIYSNKVEDLLIPYFNYFVDLILLKNIPIDRYFEIIQHRLGIDVMDSRKYVYTLLQLIDQWSKYNSRNPFNPFAVLAEKIGKSGVLRNVTTPLFQQNDVNRFYERVSIGKHREAEYVIPPVKVVMSEEEVRKKMEEYERRIAELVREGERMKGEIGGYRREGEERGNMLISKVLETIPNGLGGQNNGQENIHQNLPPNILQSIANNIVPNGQPQPGQRTNQKPIMQQFGQAFTKINRSTPQPQPQPQPQPNLISSPHYHPNLSNLNLSSNIAPSHHQHPPTPSPPPIVNFSQQLTYHQTDYNKNIILRQKHINQLMVKSKLVNRPNLQQNYENPSDYNNYKSELYRNNSEKRVVMRGEVVDDVSKIHKLSDAVKYKEFKKSKSRMNLERY